MRLTQETGYNEEILDSASKPHRGSPSRDGAPASLAPLWLAPAAAGVIVVAWALCTPALCALPRGDWSPYIIAALLCGGPLLGTAILIALRRARQPPGAALWRVPEIATPASLALIGLFINLGLAALWRLRSSTAWAVGILASNTGIAIGVCTVLGVLLHTLRFAPPKGQRPARGRGRPEAPPASESGRLSSTTSLGLSATSLVLSGWLLSSGYVIGQSQEQLLRRSVQEASDLAAVIAGAALHQPRAELARIIAALASPPTPQGFVVVLDNRGAQALATDSERREVRLPEGRPTGVFRVQVDARNEEYRCTLLVDGLPTPRAEGVGVFSRRRGVPCALRPLPQPVSGEPIEAESLLLAVAVPPIAGGFSFSFALSFLGTALLFSLLGLLLGQAASQDMARDLTRLAEDLDSMDLGRGAEGLLIPLSASATQEIGQLGQSLSALRALLFDEVSRYEQALARAEDADRRKTEFIGDVGRELRAPLEEILSNARRLLSGDDGELLERQREDVQIIQQGAQHLLELLRDILDVSVLQGGLRLGKRGAVDVVGLSRDLIRSLRPLINEQRVQMRLQVQPATPQALADGQAVRRILGNLLSNAVKFTSEGEILVLLEAWPGPDPANAEAPMANEPGESDPVAELESAQALTASQERQWLDRTIENSNREGAGKALGPFLRVSVRDTGPGIPMEDLSKLFGEYIQLGTPWERARGTGLGLAIARRLCALHGGAIDVESELGQGTTFRFTLPAVPRAPRVSGRATSGGRRGGAT